MSAGRRRPRLARRDLVALVLLLALAALGVAIEPIWLRLDDDLAVHAAFYDRIVVEEGLAPWRTYDSPGEQLDPWGRALEMRLIPRARSVPADMERGLVRWYVDPRREALVFDARGRVVARVPTSSFPVPVWSLGVLYSRGPDGRDDLAVAGTDDLPLRETTAGRLWLLDLVAPVSWRLAALFAVAWLAGRMSSHLAGLAPRALILVTVALLGAGFADWSLHQAVSQYLGVGPSTVEVVFVPMGVGGRAAVDGTLALLLALTGALATVRPPRDREPESDDTGRNAAGEAS